MVNAISSNGVLNTLYSHLHSSGVHYSIIQFLNALNPSTYSAMAAAISAWITSDAAKQSIGLSSVDAIPGFRVQVIEADGKTAYDSGSTTNNAFANIGVPASNFLTTGKYLINENQNTRIYNMSAALSQTGIAYHTKYSNSVNANQMYIAARQGNTIEPLGNVVISMNASY